MTKLKKLFPLSFKFNKSPVKLFLGILLYLVFNAVAACVIDIVISIFMAPLLIFAIPYVGWILALLCFPLLFIYILVLSYVNSFALSLIKIYAIAGIVVSFIAYAKSEDEEPEEETEDESSNEEEADEFEETEEEVEETTGLPELEPFEVPENE